MSEKIEASSAEQKRPKREAGDEDVDIGDDMPMSSFPPVEIEKDVGGGHASSSSSGSSSSSSSDSSSSSGTNPSLNIWGSLKFIISETNANHIALLIQIQIQVVLPGVTQMMTMLNHSIADRF